MQAVKRQFNEQAQPLIVIGFALLVVLLYSFWGASVLRAKQYQAQSNTSTALTIR